MWHLWLALAFLVLGGAFFSFRRLLGYLRFFQQEEYNAGRFLAWVRKRGLFDTRCSAAALVAWGVDAAGAPILALWLGVAALWGLAWWEDDPRKSGKLPLQMTARARRIVGVAVFLSLFSFLAFVLVSWALGWRPWPGILLWAQIQPLELVLANWMLSKDESRRQRFYVAEAKDIVARVQPYVIGITGSYGKTSSKEVLSQILQVTQGATFWPKKGVNTEMGITREIRENLCPGSRYAVIEMAAYRRGSIRRLCELMPPRAGLITAIGSTHLERFGSLENIYLGKSELAQALPRDGLLVCQGDDEGARRVAREFPTKTTLLYGFDNKSKDLACWCSSWKMTPEGTDFVLCWQEKQYSGHTALLGRTALSNILGAFTLACALGSEPSYALAVIHTLEAVDNRLQAKREGTITYLRDAYNSNPVGFAAALEVMASLPAKRRVIMTPGIIELGPRQAEENERMGGLCAKVCDFAVIVGETNREALKAGAVKGGLPVDRLVLCSTRAEAFEAISRLQQEGDLILIENDLTDLYETSIRF